MTESGLRVALAAEEAAGVQALRLLAGRGVPPVFVLADRSASRARGAAVADVAARMGLDVLPAVAVTDAALGDRLRRDRVDVLVNVHSLHVAHPDVVEAPRIGSFNLHPGPLPEYAGLNAPSWSIYHGEREHAVTLHWMTAAIDAGPIAYASRFPIGADDTGLTVALQCVRRGLPLIERLLDDAARDHSAVPRLPQDLSVRRYFGRDVPQAGWIEWERTAAEVVDFVRACDYRPFESPWGRPRSLLDGEPVEVLSVSRSGVPADRPPGTIGVLSREPAVAAADEWVLVRELARDGRRAPATDLPAGSRLERATIDVVRR